MKIGIIGFGVVGGTLYKWLLDNKTPHTIALYDPPRNIKDDLSGCEHIFISVPVPAATGGQDHFALEESVRIAKQHTDNVYIRSTVLPGTNNRLSTIAMPEFLTERRALLDFERLPILVGGGKRTESNRFEEIFPNKKILRVSNTEAELTKFTHNCFGAMKVSYFNIIEELSRKLGADYDRVVEASLITGFIEPTHTQVPGPDGKRGYGGKCFPENIAAMERFLSCEDLKMPHARMFFEAIDILNFNYRHERPAPVKKNECVTSYPVGMEQGA